MTAEIAPSTTRTIPTIMLAFVILKYSAEKNPKMEEKIQNSQTSSKMHFNALKAKADKDWLKKLKL